MMGLNSWFPEIVFMIRKEHLYTGIHKGQRLAFGQLSNLAGTIDFNDVEAVERLYSLLMEMKVELHGHAELEEKFIHPLLRESVPGAARRIEDEHVIMHLQLDELLANLEAIMAKPPDYDLRRDMGQEFYLAWNRFISFYFAHINDEEENIQRELWDLYTNEELLKCFTSIISGQSPEQLMQNLQIMLPALNMEESVAILLGVKAIAPPPAQEAIYNMAKEILEPERWEELSSRIEMIGSRPKQTTMVER